MAIEGQPVFDESFTASTAGGTLSQYCIVRSTAQNTVALCIGSSGGAAGPRGVLQNDPTSGEAATVRLIGTTKIAAGGSVGIGDLITSTTGGQALTAATTGQLCIGRANSASTAAGQIIEAFLFGGVFFTAGATA